MHPSLIETNTFFHLRQIQILAGRLTGIARQDKRFILERAG